MTKGTYNVKEGDEPTQRQDASYKSCLCALLIFVAICVLILLIGLNWRKSPNEPTHEKEEVEYFDKEKLMYSPTTESSTTRKLLPVTRHRPTTARPRVTVKTTVISTKASLFNETTTVAYVTDVHLRNSTSKKFDITSSTESYYLTNLTTRLPVNYSTAIHKRTTVTSATNPITRWVTSHRLYNTTVADKFESTTRSDHSTNNYVVGFKDNNTINKIHTDITTEEATTENTTPVMNELDIIATSLDDLIISDGGGDVLVTDIFTRSEQTTETTEYNKLSTVKNITDITEVTTFRSNISTSKNPQANDETFSTEVIVDDMTEATTIGSTHLRNIRGKPENQTESVTDLILTTEINVEITTDESHALVTARDSTFTESDVVSDINPSTKRNTNVSVTDIQEIDDITTTEAEKREINDSTTIFRTKSFPIPFDKPEPVCNTSGCKSAASRMLSLMNHSVDACEDFYEFSCGGMQADNAESDTWNRLSRQLNDVNRKSPIFLHKFKQFYDSCVNYEDDFIYEKRIKSVKNILETTGHLYADDNPKDVNLTHIFAKLVLLGSLPLMDIGIDVDKQTSNYILKLTLPQRSSAASEIEHWSALLETQRRCLKEERRKIYEPNLNLTEMHVSYLRCNKNYRSYLNSIERTLESLGFYSNLDAQNATKKIRDVRFFIDYDILALFENGPAAERRKVIINKEYTIQKIAELQVLYPLLDWKLFLKLLTGHDVHGGTLIQVYFPNHFQHVFKKLGALSPRKLNNALLAIFANDLFQNLIVSNRYQREEYCMTLSSSLFHDVSSNLYMHTSLSADVKEDEQRVIQIFDILKVKLTEALNKEEWLDSSSKISSIKKVQSLKVYFANKNDECISEQYLNLKYKSLHLGSDYVSNLITMKEEMKTGLYSLEGQSFREDVIFCRFIYPYDKKPFSFYAKELIAVPFGILKELPKNLPEYLTAARIGIHLSRAIGSHFDPVGIHYKMLLSESSQTTYNTSKDTTQNMLSFATTRNNTNQQVLEFQPSGDLSINDRIADNTALRLLTDSYDKLVGKTKLLPWISTSYTKQKIFFIAIAQEYCQRLGTLEYMLQVNENEILPPSLRVENIMSNSDAFSEAFKCPEGARLNNNYNKIQFPYLPKFEYEDNYEGIAD